MKQKLLSLLALTFCWASSMMALDKDANDVYQIGSAQDLRDFATAVNSGEYGAFAVLTTDIDLNNEAWTSPIGSESHPYTGTFDGRGFTISNFIYNTTANNTGFFGNLGNDAVVQNFTIEGSINSTHQRVGVIGSVGSSSSTNTDITTISNIHSKINLTCTQTRHGGILGAQNGLGTINIDRCTYSGTFTANNISGNFGGIVGLSNNNSGSTINITNCLFDGEINIGTGDNAGGFVGYTRGCKLTIKNCLSNGTIQATNPGQFIGQINTTCRQKYDGVNYYVTGNTLGSTGGSAATEGGTAPVAATSAQLASGEICYLLNGSINGTNWFQTKGDDDYPVPSSTSKRIYYKTSTSAYINIDGLVQIGSAADMNDFSIMVNHGGFDLDAELTDDIDMASIAATWIPIGNWGQESNGVSSAAYKGHFNGQGYNITNFNGSTLQNYYGLFGVISTGCLIENFSISGTITYSNSKHQYAGGIAAYARDPSPTIRNVKSSVNINNSISSSARIGGILGGALNGTTTIQNCTYTGATIQADNIAGNYGGIVGYVNNNANAILTISNCLFEGTVEDINGGEGECGGIIGFASTSSTTTIENCLSVGTITSTKAGMICGIIAGTKTFTNNYYKEGDVAENGPGGNAAYTATTVTTEQLSSGEVCYLLNGSTSGGTNWYQTLGTDDNPYPYDTHGIVYKNAIYLCPNTTSGEVTYSNTNSSTIPDHTYTDGFCPYCNTLDEHYMDGNIVGGYYGIGTPAQLKWFAAYVNQVDASVNARLTNITPIDLTGITMQPIGNAGTPYTGTFDGGGHAITNFSYTATSNGGNGLFGYVRNATIKDFSISGELTSEGFTYNGTIGAAEANTVISGIHSALDITLANKGAHSGGILGSTVTSGNPVLIKNCEYSGTMTHSGSGDCQAGILGYTYNGGVKNCIFSGTINGESSKYGGILGYCKIASFIGVQNCLSIGKIVANDGNMTAAAIIANYNGGATENIKNNYYLLKDGSTTSIAIGNQATNCEAPVLATTENLASGEVAYKLNGDQSEINWYQTIGTDAYPTLSSASEQVLYVGTAGYTTFYDATNGWELLGDAKAYIGTINGSALHLDEIEDIPANEAVVIGGTYYNRVSKASTTGDATGNVLRGSDGTVKGGTNIYALSTLGGTEPVGFYPVGNDVTIPEGKAYLVYSGSSPVKGFTFVFDDDATSINEELRMKNEEFNEGAIYNIAGQRMNKMQKGINIINGKKVMVK